MAAQGLYVGARVCLVSDSERCGVVESYVHGAWWAVRFADKSRNIRFDDLKVLPYDDATFEPSQAPQSLEETRQDERTTTAAAQGVHVGARVCLVNDSVRRGVVESKGAGGHWVVRFADKSCNIRAYDLETLPSNDPTFELSQAPQSGIKRRQELQAISKAGRGSIVGARVYLVSDSTRRGVVKAEVGGGCCTVQFADKSRNIRVNDLKVLPSDAATFKPSQAPPSLEEKRREERVNSGVYVGARVYLLSDSARRGVAESKGAGGCWAVQFADKSRNIRVHDLKVLPSDAATFEPSQAPPSHEEKRREERVNPGVYVGARVYLLSDSARRGVVESKGAGGCWAVQFADKSRNIRVHDLKVLPSDAATFEPSQAPPSREGARKRYERVNPGLYVGARVCLVSDSARRGVVDAEAVGGCYTVRFADKSRNIRVNGLKVLPSDAATFEPSQAPPSCDEKQQEEQVNSGVYVGARVYLVSDSARRGVVKSKVVGGHWPVRFADKSRNIRAKDLKVLLSDDATFEPSQAPPSCDEKRQEERVNPGVNVGARVYLVSDSARRGVVIRSKVVGGCCTVRFADKSRNIRLKDLAVLLSDDLTFEPSQAPLSCGERKQETQAKASAVDWALERATRPPAASSRKRHAEASDNGGGEATKALDDGAGATAAARVLALDDGAGATAAAEDSGDGKKLGENASDDELRVKRLKGLGAEALESAPLLSSLDGHCEKARLRAFVVAVTEDRDNVTEDRDDHEDGCNMAYKFIEQQKDVIGGLKDEIGDLRREIDGLRREAQRRDAAPEAGARYVAELEADAIEAPPQPTKRRARPM